MRILTAFILLMSWCAGATTFTEFYCDTSNGSTNINAGSTTNSAAVYSSVNGNWDGTSVYTPTDGSTPASTVSAGMWGAIFIDGSTNLVQTSAGGCVMLITNVAAGANGAITFDRSAFMGTAPSSSATGRSINVGGCWNGPYGTIGFPFGFATSSGTNGPTALPRVNLRNTAQYNITAAMTHANAGPVRFQGMTATPSDGGKATIDGGTSVNYYILLTLSGADTDMADLIFANNGSGGSAQVGISTSGARCTWRRCVVHNVRQSGWSIGTSPALFVECEAYTCNQANTANHGAFLNNIANSVFVRCIAHDNSGNSNNGFHLGSGAILLDCISDSNGKSGAFGQSSSTTPSYFVRCNFYANTASGIDIANTAVLSHYIENCNFISNGAYGISSSGSLARNGYIVNCGFGTGTKTNASGNITASLSGIEEISTVLYAADTTPWIDPDNGNFTLTNTATAKAAGRGSFTETAASYSGTIGYPDIGAAQLASTNTTATASGGAYTWAQ